LKRWQYDAIFIFAGVLIGWAVFLPPALINNYAQPPDDNLDLNQNLGTQWKDLEIAPDYPQSIQDWIQYQKQMQFAADGDPSSESIDEFHKTSDDDVFHYPDQPLGDYKQIDSTDWMAASQEDAIYDDGSPYSNEWKWTTGGGDYRGGEQSGDGDTFRLWNTQKEWFTTCSISFEYHLKTEVDIDESHYCQSYLRSNHSFSWRIAIYNGFSAWYPTMGYSSTIPANTWTYIRKSLSGITKTGCVDYILYQFYRNKDASDTSNWSIYVDWAVLLDAYFLDVNETYGDYCEPFTVVSDWSYSSSSASSHGMGGDGDMIEIWHTPDSSNMDDTYYRSDAINLDVSNGKYYIEYGGKVENSSAGGVQLIVDYVEGGETWCEQIFQEDYGILKKHLSEEKTIYKIRICSNDCNPVDSGDGIELELSR
jgi:hypothetical protein